MSQIVEDRIYDNMCRLAEVPEEVLPPGLARYELASMLMVGYDIQAFQSHSHGGEWGLWIADLADSRSDHNGYVPMSQWALYWKRYVREAGLEEAA